MSKDAVDLDLWERGLAGDVTATERARIRAWVIAVAGDPPDPDRLRDAVDALEIEAGAPSVDAARVLRGVRARISRVAPARSATGARFRRSPVRSADPHGHAWRTAGLAAALAAAAAGLVIASARSRGTSGAGGVHEYVARFGERVHLTLADGTDITLAPGSRLRVPLTYGRTTRRDVALDGEALFRVVHDARHPFVASAGAARFTDAGTVFDVRAYASDSMARVAVADGRVAIGGAAGTLVGRTLVAGDVAVVDATGHVLGITTGDAAAFTAWTRGELVFDDARVADALRTLERWYALDITVDTPVLLTRHLTLDLRDVTADRALDAVAILLHARVTRHGNVVTLLANPNDR